MEEQQSTKRSNEARGGPMKWWGQIGPILYKNGKLFYEALAIGGVEEASR